MHTNNGSTKSLSAKWEAADTTHESLLLRRRTESNETCGRPGRGKMHSENYVDACQLSEWQFKKFRVGATLVETG